MKKTAGKHEEISYEKGKMSELEDIVKIFKNAAEEMLHHQINQWNEVYPNEAILKADIENEELFVGKINNEIAVVYVLNQLCDEQYSNGKWTEDQGSFKVVHRLCVNPTYQNRGVGRQTMTYIEEELIKEGKRAIRLDVFSKNPFALKMYGALGYNVVGEAHWRKGLFYLMEKLINRNLSWRL